ncbi:hypothetical protein FYJ45_24980 [Eisenbergiella tayi]|uniref:HK97 gp10 family phage protein n=1 Tax=Eisenbergiella porci TaxID=2652274 RepID=A0A6N7W801_9FIRM|nr:HK97 gp10 family phage protein [Eisenbergiella porci]MSS91369.1 hypothetical protein [Eisenbergiella porci]
MAVDFMVKGLDDLQKDIEELISKYPDETNAKMKQIGKEFTKDCNSQMPPSYKKGKRPIPKSWKVTVDEERHVATQTYIKNTAPHFHLVENGHKKWINGVDTGGTVPGKHYAEKTSHEYEEKFPDEIEAFLDEMLKGNKL